jgi:hypothetical protein
MPAECSILLMLVDEVPRELLYTWWTPDVELWRQI